MTESRRILKDTELCTATEEEIRGHYALIAERYRSIRPDAEPMDVEETIKAFAGFVQRRACDITFVPAAEASGWLPLSADEDERLTSSE